MPQDEEPRRPTHALGPEDRWRLLFENVPYVITEIDPDGRVLLTNRPPPGRRLEDVVGSCIYDVVPESLREGLRAAVARVLASGEIYNAEARVPTPAGDTWWMTRFVPVKRDGGVRSVVAIATDITPRKRAEKALRESEERLALALDAARDGVWDWDVPSGRVVYNERWGRMLGWAPEEIAPDVEGWRGLVHPDDAAALSAALEGHLGGATESCEVEHRLRTKSGEWKWVLTRGKVVARAADGRPLRMTGTQRDIDAEKRLAEEREGLIGQLREALEKVRTLSGLLPICGSCKKIRDDAGYWQRIEQYLGDHTGAQFSHGLCPQCAERLHADLRQRYPATKPRPGG